LKLKKAGGMTLYCKAGPDQISIGDCPFAHYVRLVLEEKNLEYDIKPCVQDTKPFWLIDYYDGKMPALRHRKECYIESDIIVSYLEFFFPIPSLTINENDKESMIIQQQAEDAINGIFPTIAKYIKHTTDNDETDHVLLENLQTALEKLNQHFLHMISISKDITNREIFYLTGSNMTLLDCSLAPKLYHMKIACEEFKKHSTFTIPSTIQTYMDHMFQRESFQKTLYPKETVIWGWTNARN
jgi:glutathione dehydrogenase/transferase